MLCKRFTFDLVKCKSNVSQMLEALSFCFAMLTFLLRKNVQTWVLVFLQSKNKSKNLDFVKKTSNKKHNILILQSNTK